MKVLKGPPDPFELPLLDAPGPIARPEIEAEPTSFRRDSTTPTAPVPSGADIATKAAPRPGVAVTGSLGARIGALTGVGVPTPGERALAKRFDAIEQMVKDGVRVRCVFDLDNTVFDTRHRTLFCAQEFDRENGTHHFDGLMASAVKIDGRETAISLQLPDDVIEAFGAFWDKAFWSPGNLVHDVALGPIVELVKEAQRRGAEVVFLTGRTERYEDAEGQMQGFRADTHAQLQAAGIDVDDEHLVLKPGVHERTAPFKQAWLESWNVDTPAQQSEVGFFLTEGRRDIEHLLGTMPTLTCFRLDASFEDGGPACAGVPVLPRLM